MKSVGSEFSGQDIDWKEELQMADSIDSMLRLISGALCRPLCPNNNNNKCIQSLDVDEG